MRDLLDFKQDCDHNKITTIKTTIIISSTASQFRKGYQTYQIPKVALLVS